MSELAISNEVVARTLLAKLDPFQLELLAVIGHYGGISYDEITKLRPIDKQSIYNAVASGKLKRNANGPYFNWANLKTWLENTGRL